MTAPPPHQPLAPQFIRFLVAGGLATALHMAVLHALVAGLGVRPWLASAGGYLAGAVLNYTLAHHWVFRSRRGHHSALWRFAAMAASGLVLNSVLVGWLTTQAAWHHLPAQVVATGAVLFWNFFGNRRWTFRPPA